MRDVQTVFVDHHASGPSGISTYGAHLAANLPNFLRINLHAGNAAGAGCVDVPAQRSHDPLVIADLLVRTLDDHPNHRIAWLPNVGDVSWAGAWHALMRLPRGARERVRIFGIVHGDQRAQYDAMSRYAPIVAGFAGVSQRCVDGIAAALPDRTADIELLNYPVEVPHAQSTPVPHAPLRLLYAGRFEESQKRISRLPLLFERLRQAGIPFDATIAGDGPDRQTLVRSLEASASSHTTTQAAGRVHVIGAVSREHMPALLARHDILLLVSAFEGTPLVVLEAMATGLCPVIMSLPGGLPELLTDGVNACVAGQGDIDGMVAALTTLHRDRAALVSLQSTARETIAGRASPQAHALRLASQLDALWNRRPPAPEEVGDPDPIGRRIDSLVAGVRTAQPARVAVWGAGVIGRQIVDRLLDAGIAPAAVVDADPIRHGAYREVVIADPLTLAAAAPDIVCVGSVAFAAEITSRLRCHTPMPEILIP